MRSGIRDAGQKYQANFHGLGCRPSMTITQIIAVALLVKRGTQGRVLVVHRCCSGAATHDEVCLRRKRVFSAGSLGMRTPSSDNSCIGGFLLCRALGLVAVTLLAISGIACTAAVRPSSEVPDQAVFVTFLYSGHAPRSVCVAASFNDWSPDSLCMQRSEGIWSARVNLPPGRYRYGFIIDGEVSTEDPQNPLYEDDGFGSRSSVLIVE
jgi:hypothetical protein